VSGLKAIHIKGIIHRDLKPENIFVNFYQNELILKIADLGLAKNKELTSTMCGYNYIINLTY
jgi:serine/threonine-protein kinase